MMRRTTSRWSRWSLVILAAPMLLLLVLPVGSLLLASSPGEMVEGMRHPLFLSSLWLSLKTTLISLVGVIVGGTPLAWWLATRPERSTRLVSVLVALPIVLPPAVVGIALLQTFGHRGLLGAWLEALSLQVPFTTAAVVIAQVVVSAPFYIQSAAAAFRQVDDDLLLVARTLGQSPVGAFFRVALPAALPGMSAGAVLAWARAMGEFGATLLFAGNLPGVTQTVPLAIYSALESDVRAALALSLVLAALSVLVLLGLRGVPTLWDRGGRE